MKVHVVATAFDGIVFEGAHYNDVIAHCTQHEHNIIQQVYVNMIKNVEIITDKYDAGGLKLLGKYSIVHILNKQGVSDINKYCEYMGYHIIFDKSHIGKYMLVCDTIPTGENVYVCGDLEEMYEMYLNNR